MTPSQTSNLTHRSSLACTTCRDRHVRCDGTRPRCSRCSFENRPCLYTPSRRGGLTRAELAARRAAKDRGTHSRRYDGADHVEILSRPNQVVAAAALATTTTTTSTANNNLASLSPSLLASVIDSTLTLDPLLELYYRHFHRHHPFILPQRYMNQVLSNEARKHQLEPLVASMKFIGGLYADSDQVTVTIESVRLAIRARDAVEPDPALAQCRLLYSIATYWCGDKDTARQEMDAALNIAIGLGMHRREFARDSSGDDAVLAESLRRTWWSIYTIDAWYAAIRKKPTFATRDIHVTTELPCEEREYESGIIPRPKTLEDFDHREFSPENHVYSSFAYLIGATRGIASAIASVPSDAGHTFSTPEIIQTVDAIVEGWELLLPECKREVLAATGEFDELMFQAFMSIYASMIGLHRPYSSLYFNPIEAQSSCSHPVLVTTTNPQSPTSGVVTATSYRNNNNKNKSKNNNKTNNNNNNNNHYYNIHTTQCLRSIQAQVRLLALPARPFCHTPFAICMMTTGTITLLSACKFLHQRHQDTATGGGLSLRRYQVRLGMGCLMAMAHVWPQGKRHLSEVQAIAREVLGIGHGRDGDGDGSLGASTGDYVADTAVPTTPDTRTVADMEQQQGGQDFPNLSDFPVFVGGSFDGSLDLNGMVPTDSFWFSTFFASENGMA